MPDRSRPKGLLIVGIALVILLGSGSFFIWRAFSGYPLFWVNNIGGGSDEDLKFLEELNIEEVGINTDEIPSLSFADSTETVLEEATVETAETTLEVNDVIPDEIPLSIWDRVTTHVVQKGESLWTIAKKYNVDVDTLIGSNELKSHDNLSIGQKITILPFKGATHKVEKGESLWTIAQRYNVSINEIVETNALSSQNIRVGEVLVVPGATLSSAEKERRLLIARGGLPAFIRPVSGGWISSRFGMRWGKMHQGLDLAVNTGTPVRAAAGGTVTQAGNAGTYGVLVIIKHANGFETRYAHNSKVNVKVGQYVKQGDIIAYSGNTGNSTGPHLHFEVRLNGNPQDPLKYLE